MKNVCPSVLASQKVQSHGALCYRGDCIRVDFDGKKLILSGELPSFHLKQLAQEILRDLRLPILNEIRVVRSE